MHKSSGKSGIRISAESEQNGVQQDGLAGFNRISFEY